MSVVTVLLDAVVHTDYGQFDIVWREGAEFDGDFDRCFEQQVNGLVGAASGDGIYLHLARRSGGSSMQILLFEAPPLTPDDDWEDVVEVSIDIPAGAQPRWGTWAWESSGDLAIEPGSYRVRTSARGRDTGHDQEFAEDTVDFYRLEVWPAAHRPDAVLRVTSDDARYWHQELGGRR